MSQETRIASINAAVVLGANEVTVVAVAEKINAFLTAEEPDRPSVGLETATH